MKQGLARLWESFVFVLEFLGAIVFGVPMGIVVGLAIGVFVYFVTFRALTQSLAAMWRKRRAGVVASLTVNVTDAQVEAAWARVLAKGLAVKPAEKLPN